MKKTLYLKFILAYFIFGVFGFIIVTTFVPNMTKEHLIREKAESLYSEATLIAGTYAGGLYTSETTLETVIRAAGYGRIKILDDYHILHI